LSIASKAFSSRVLFISSSFCSSESPNQTSRHSFAMSRLQAGFSYEEVGAVLGHSNPQTTRRYARLRAEQVKHGL